MIMADANSDYIFGITKIQRLNSVAGNRGLPNDISSQVATNIEDYREFEKEETNFYFDELFGFSFIIYDEVLKYELHDKLDKHSKWLDVFETMNKYFVKGYSANNLRVVVWANW
jgi:hypothetical protein